MRITFTRDYTVNAAGGESYKAGQTIECSEESARHFINRGAAEEAAEKPALPAPKPKDKEPAK